MSPRPPRFSLPGWLLTSLLSALGGIIVVYAVHIHSTLNEEIMQGFDRKLLAISTTTASFFDPADHASIIEPLPVTALAPSPSDAFFWASDPKKNLLWKIDPTDGSASATSFPLPAGFDRVAAGPDPANLLLASSLTGELSLLSLADGKSAPVAARLTPPLSALASDPAGAVLYAVGTHFDRLDLRTGRSTRVAKLEKNYLSLAFDPRDQSLWALDANGTELVNLNPADGAERSRVLLAPKKPDATPADWKPKPVRFVAFALEPKSFRLLGAEGSILGGSRGLLWIDPKTGEVSGDGLRPNFNRELRPMNLSYARPLRRISNRTNLTFLYTHVYAGEENIDKIVYGADGTVGAEHSPPLSEDVVPPTEIAGMKALMERGTTHLTQVKAWNQWGLLKSAWAPIFGPDGRPVAMAGADINITTIRDATRRALVITFSFGALQLLLAGLVSLAIARQLTRPIAAVKAAALRTAAGDYGQTIQIPRPSELTELAVDFCGAATDLGRNSQALDAAVSEGRALRDRRALTTQLATAFPLVGVAPAGTPWAWGAHDTKEEIPSGGAVLAGENALAWISAPPSGEPLAAAIRRARVAVTAHALLVRHGAEPTTLAPALLAALAGETLAWVLLAPSGTPVLTSPPAPPPRTPSSPCLPPLAARRSSSAPRRPRSVPTPPPPSLRGATNPLPDHASRSSSSPPYETVCSGSVFPHAARKTLRAARRAAFRPHRALRPRAPRRYRRAPRLWPRRGHPLRRRAPIPGARGRRRWRRSGRRRTR